jgi:hypothetical protein
MNYEGIDWNEEWVRSMTEDEFVNSSLNRVHWTEAPNIAPTAVRIKRLHELWQLLNPKANANDQQSVTGVPKSRLAFPDGEQHD